MNIPPVNDTFNQPIGTTEVTVHLSRQQKERLAESEGRSTNAIENNLDVSVFASDAKMF